MFFCTDGLEELLGSLECVWREHGRAVCCSGVTCMMLMCRCNPYVSLPRPLPQGPLAMRSDSADALVNFR